MNFHFNEEEQEILNMLHDYAVKEVAPRAHEIDEEEKFLIILRRLCGNTADRLFLVRTLHLNHKPTCVSSHTESVVLVKNLLIYIRKPADLVIRIVMKSTVLL